MRVRAIAVNTGVYLNQVTVTPVVRFFLTLIHLDDMATLQSAIATAFNNAGGRKLLDPVQVTALATTVHSAERSRVQIKITTSDMDAVRSIDDQLADGSEWQIRLNRILNPASPHSHHGKPATYSIE